MRVSMFLAPAAPALKAVRNAKLMVNMWRRPKISLNGAQINGPIYRIQLAYNGRGSLCTGKISQQSQGRIAKLQE